MLVLYLYLKKLSTLVEDPSDKLQMYVFFWQDKQLQLDVACMQSGSQNDQPLYHRKNV